MDIVGLNIVPVSLFDRPDMTIVFIFQNGRTLEDYVEEFISVSHHTTCDNLTLMERFRSGLDDEIWMVMPKGDSCWTLG